MNNLPSKNLTLKLLLDTSNFDKKINHAVNRMNRYSDSVNKQIANELKLNRTTAGRLETLRKSNQELSKGEQAALRLANAEAKVQNEQRKQLRASYEQWWQAALIRQEWEKAHPVLAKLSNQWNKIDSKIRSATSNSPRLTSMYNKITSKVKSWATGHKAVETSARRINTQYMKSNTLLSTLHGKVMALASAYLGVLGIKGITGLSDTITSAENKLNYTSAQALGSAGYNANGTYSTAVFNATQDAMDKMYASSQKVRMSYADMMTNVSKSMALAGDAFQNSTDNAIRFQEIMAEAYAVGGASAAEMSSSMYQLMQALGSGILQGDELRSVREGAPLAYNAIEQFAQGVYNTDESLKELASQGKITSDMVVAAVMNAGNEMDAAFAQTKQTFIQTWDQIKNAAMYAFRPISDMLRETLNEAVDNGLIQKVEKIFATIGKAVMIIVKVVINALTWIADHWDYIKSAIIAGLIMISAHVLITAISWLVLNWQMVLTLAGIFAIIYAIVLFKQGVIDACTAAGIALLGVAAIAFLIFGWQVALIIALVALVIMFFDVVCGVGWGILTFIGNLIQNILNIIAVMIALVIGIIWTAVAFVLNTISAAVMGIATLIQWIVAFVVNLVMGCVNAIVTFIQNLFTSASAIAQNIGIAFTNAFYTAAEAAYNFVADALSYFSKLAPVIDGIASLMGKDFSLSSAISGLRDKANSYSAKHREYVDYKANWSTNSVGDAWSKGWNTMEYADMSDALSKGWNTFGGYDWGNAIETAYGTFGTGLEDWGWKEAYNDGSNWGAGIMDFIDNLLSGDSENESKGGILDKIGEMLGLDFSKFNQDFPNADNPANSVLDAYDPSGSLGSIGDNLKDIADDTSDIKDSMDLTEEDLEYLRKLAAMEWRKEYTNNINIDMTNNNTVNNTNDLDGIVTKLTEKLYEELQATASGVYA